MKRSYRLARAPQVRRAIPSAVALLALLTQVAACQPEPVPGPEPVGTPEQPSGGSSPNPPTDTTPQTSPFTLAASSRDPDTSTEPPPQAGGAFIGLLTTESALGTLDFRYDAFVVTAVQTGKVIIQADVLAANHPSYPYGYGYPLTMAAIEDGVTFTAYGGSYLQDALWTGTAIIDYPVVKGRQYMLVYKTFGAFTPLKYRLTLSSEVRLEGRVHAPPLPVPIPTNSAGPITLENPRPDVLNRVVPWLNDRVSGD